MDIQLFQRQIILAEIGKLGQQLINNAKVLIIGAGGLGCPVIQYLHAAGVQQLAVIDGDIVSKSNLHRQILYTNSDIGKYKVSVLQQRYGSAIQVFPYHISIENVLETIAQFDIIVDTSDNFATRYLINDACVLQNKIVVSAAIDKWTGQLAVFNYQLDNGLRSATYRCLFDTPPEQTGNCATNGVMGTSTAIIGALQAQEVIKVILRHPSVCYNKLLLFDTLHHQQHIIAFNRNEHTVQNILKNGIVPISSYNCNIQYTNISYDELKQWQNNNTYFKLIDVRTADEHSLYNIGGQHIPANELLYNKEIIEANCAIVLYCSRGERSAIAAQRLYDKNKNLKLFNLQYGIDKLMN